MTCCRVGLDPPRLRPPPGFEQVAPRPSSAAIRKSKSPSGCRMIDAFQCLGRIGKGTYGVVYRAKDLATGEVVAIKRLKLKLHCKTSLREIKYLSSCRHPSIIQLKEVVTDDRATVYIVMEYAEHDLKSLLWNMPQLFHEHRAREIMLHLLQGVAYLHRTGILHRDLKTANLLVNRHGALKICDFGICRRFDGSPGRYTQPVGTLWYRAPELLLGAKDYSVAIDLWSVGCIMAELVCKEPLFPGKTEMDQLDKIFGLLGTPDDRAWPGFKKLPLAAAVGSHYVSWPHNRLREKLPYKSLSSDGFELLSQLLAFDPDQRITAEAALRHPWFQCLRN